MYITKLNEDCRKGMHINVLCTGSDSPILISDVKFAGSTTEDSFDAIGKQDLRCLGAERVRL